MHDNDQPDGKERFVGDLHTLWEQSGSPKWAAMAARCSVSKTSLNDAANRTDRLPSRRVVREFLIALGVEEHDEWLTRREELAVVAKQVVPDKTVEVSLPTTQQEGLLKESPTSGGGSSLGRKENTSSARTFETSTERAPAKSVLATSDTGSVAGTGNDQRGRRKWLGRPRIVVAGIVSLALVATGAAVFLARGRTVTAQKPPTVRSTVGGMRVFFDVPNGSDPTQTRCLEDAMNFGQSNLEGVGSLKMVHSPSCRAYWARVERVDGRTIGNTSFAAVYLKDSPGTRQEVDIDDAMVIFTPLLVAEDGDRVCVEGTITVDGTVHTLEPLC